MTSIIEEEGIRVFGEQKSVVDKKMPVFFNPVMKFNRDVSIVVLNALNKKNMIICDPLAGSGIRSLRFLKELKKGIIKELHVNDLKPNYEFYFKNNLNLNEINDSVFFIHNTDANAFLNERRSFDYIDIDPFGSPNPFLDSAIKTLRSDGILAVTATDTSALCGSYPTACKRKYWANPLRNHLMHEFGLRILIRKIQLVGIQYEKALIPVFSYSKDHYMRVFFVNKKGKKECDKLLAMHSFYVKADELFGPVWTGELWSDDLISLMKRELDFLDKSSLKFLEVIFEESKIKEFGFFDIHKLAKGKLKGNLPSFESISKVIKEKGYNISRTHFCDTGLKTDAPQDVVEEVLFCK